MTALFLKILHWSITKVFILDCVDELIWKYWVLNASKLIQMNYSIMMKTGILTFFLLTLKLFVILFYTILYSNKTTYVSRHLLSSVSAVLDMSFILLWMPLFLYCLWSSCPTKYCLPEPLIALPPEARVLSFQISVCLSA